MEINNDVQVIEPTTLVTDTQDIQDSLTVFENNMMDFLDICGLPCEDVLVSIKERKAVIKNIFDPLELLTPEKRVHSMYLSKFLAAVSSGLFDAALNYLWDETILQLRHRVAQYDIQYFFDIAVKSPERRSKLNDIEDLVKIDDQELIEASKEIGLITDIGYRHLDYIKYMRNWASAAHPNQVDITGLNLIAWLETCIKEVINLPESNVTVETRKLLKNIKTNKISQEEAKTIGAFMCDLTKEKVNALVQGFFGIYTRIDTTQDTRENIHLLLPIVWERVDDSIRNEFGIKYARYTANNDQEEAKLVRSFLQIVNGEQYLPEPIRIVEIKTALENLTNAHNSLDNFYKEPTYARQLRRLVGTHSIPKQLNYDFVMTVVNAYLTNGNGVCWDADSEYISMISQFTEAQLITVLLSFEVQAISSKLQFPLCKEKFRKLMDMIRGRITSPAAQELLAEVDKYNGPLYKMKDDAKLKKQLATIKTILK